MKVLHVITSLHMGGAEKLMVDLIPRLNKKGIECDLLTFDNTVTPFRQSLELSGVKIYDFGKNGSSYSLRNLIKLIPILKRYDIVHTHNTAPQLYAAMVSLLYPAISLVTTEHNTSNRRRNWKWYAPIDRWMYSRYRIVISISDKAEEKLLDYIPNLKTEHRVVYNGIPLNDYAKSIPNIQIQNEYPDIIKIFMIAGFRYQKDHPTAIKSLQYLPDNYHLFLVGDGVERKNCEKLTSNLYLNNRVHFMGKRSDVPSLLKTADICLISSHWEGFGLAAVEGMAAGVPVVASNIPGVAEVVKGAGVLFEQGNPKDLAKIITNLINDKNLYYQVSQACVKRAQDYSIEKMVNNYFNVYVELNNLNK
ncbi:MAG: glycosyltransferase [Bacteroides sp.]|nr:glycosyltransferase [Bacteroides sp.]